MDKRIAEASGWIAGAESITVLTGAGISAESGVPTFRGEDGLWRRYRAEELATPEAYARNRKLVWEWYRYRQGVINGTKPNDAHKSLVRLEESVPSFCLITQNVDGHHRRAGSKQVVELHGNIYRARCDVDGDSRLLTGAGEETIPRCAGGHAMRPDVVWFGEALPGDALEQAWDAAQRCDLFLLIGTSSVVQPAASLPVLAKRAGARLVEVNLEETPLSGLVDLTLRGRAAKIVPLLVGG